MLQVPRPEIQPLHNARVFCVRPNSKIKSQVKPQTAARRESQEDSMKKVFLLITPQLVVSIRRRADPAPQNLGSVVYFWRKASTNGEPIPYSAMFYI